MLHITFNINKNEYSFTTPKNSDSQEVWIRTILAAIDYAMPTATGRTEVTAGPRLSHQYTITLNDVKENQLNITTQNLKSILPNVELTYFLNVSAKKILDLPAFDSPDVKTTAPEVFSDDNKEIWTKAFKNALSKNGIDFDTCIAIKTDAARDTSHLHRVTFTGPNAKENALNLSRIDENADRRYWEKDLEKSIAQNKKAKQAVLNKFKNDPAMGNMIQAVISDLSNISKTGKKSALLEDMLN